jgi:hypothetical protein
MFLPGEEAIYTGQPKGAAESGKNNLRVTTKTPKLADQTEDPLTGK